MVCPGLSLGFSVNKATDFLLACGPIEDSDQPAHLRSLIRVLNGYSMVRQ